MSPFPPGTLAIHMTDTGVERQSPMHLVPLLEAEAMLERALDARVERIQPVQGQGLDRGEAAAGPAGRTVVAEQAVQEREAALVVEHARALGDDALADDQVTQEPAFLG